MDKKTILAFVVIGLILILMPYYYKLVSPPEETDSLAVSQRESDISSYSTTEEETQRRQDYQEGRVERLPVQPVEESSVIFESTSDESPAAWHTPDPEASAEEISIATPLYRATFSTRGASITSWIILPTQPYLQEEEQLVPYRFTGRNLVMQARGGRGLLRTDEKNFKVNKRSVNLREDSYPDTLSFLLELGGDKYYRETYVFHPASYVVDIFIDSRGIEELTGAANVLFTWGGGMATTEEDTAQETYYTQANFLMGQSKETFKSKGKKADEELATGPTNWVAQRTKYFLLALVPEQPASGVKMYTWPDEIYNGKYPPKLFETGLVFNIPKGDISRHVSLYLGPLEQSFINEVDPTLELTMNWGWAIIKPFSKVILWTLKWLHTFIPNYGVVLIVFSILIKVIVWPLTHKSYQSTKRMQTLQPMIKTLQEKYKGEPQRMQKEVMGLYKEYKVNPAGGCWPVLLQMPLLYALFIVFRSTIELRGAPFMLWINDLSMPDILFHLPFNIPLYGAHVCVLPIIMAVSTFLQSKQTMTDPNQKMMLYMMPAMFIFLFNNFPSGLTLYYTLFNLLSWAQQKLMKVKDPKLEEMVEKAVQEREAAAKKVRKGGGKR